MSVAASSEVKLVQRRCARALLALVLFAAPMPAVSAQNADSSTTLFERLDYGSQAYFSPLTVLLNKGFDHFQARNTSRDVWRFPYRRAMQNAVFDALRHPRAAIDDYPGWSKWWRTEVLPMSVRPADARWAVNYTEHLVAGGLTYRMLDEWYSVHGAPWPRAWAAATTFAAAMMNEAAEFPTAERAASSTVADLYVFDLGGILLFSWDPLARFFAHRLQAADWSNQATFTAPDGALRNTGQYYVLKLPLPVDRWRLFVRGGMGAQFGLTKRLRNELSVSTAVGLDTEVRLVDPVTRDESIRMAFGGGIYIDRRNSLLASVTVGPTTQRVTVNVYPGVLPGVLRETGVWSAVTRDGRVIYGLVHRRALGLGVGYSSRQ